MDGNSSWHSWLTTYLDVSPMTIEHLSKRFELVNLPVDSETTEHTLRTFQLAGDLAKAVGFPEAQLADMRRGVILHDLGKLMIPPEILNKPGRLTSEDWAVIRRHPYFSFLLLCDIPELEPALSIPVAHHECWDGSGYPRGLQGEAIPLAARIYAVVDCWDALISQRPYRPAFSLPEARQIMTNLAGKHFDPAIVATFLEQI